MIAPRDTSPPGMGYGSGRLGVEPETEVIESVGRLIEFWGFKRALGRVWALLYLSPIPLSAADIGERLSMSSGAVSMALNELQLWGVVSRVHRPGDRKEYFGAEEDIWKMVTRVLSDRELREIESAYETFSRAEQSLKQHSSEAKHHGQTDKVNEFDFRRSRVAHLRRVTASGKTLLQGLILTSKLDASPLRMLGNLRKK
ncbi:MAG TPA: MarR family transcriptional regulator [Planctomycetota bacterium]|nr:MarR family transcriptional regulator [Planctomycetota bacterium]